MSKKSLVIYLGTNGFPFGSATVQRQLQISKALFEAGYKVTVINRRSFHQKNIARREKLKLHGYHQNIEYYYSSLVTHKPQNFILRNIFKLIGVLLEFLIIFYYKLFKNAKYILYRSSELKDSKYYYRIGKFLNLETVYDYVEFYDSLGNRGKTNIKELEESFDYQFYKYADKFIVISDYLKEHLNNISKKENFIKIPPIIDFTYFDSVKAENNLSPYFLFCGSASYDDIIKFIIETFVKSKAILNNYSLKLIINGNSSELNKLKKIIAEKDCKKQISLLTNLTYYDLVKYYKSANALLIPISDNVQDQARFPFKICEYTASKRPIITSDSGAIKEFFKDGKNAFIAKTNNQLDYVLKLNLVIDQPKYANEVGLNGYTLGNSVFNYCNYSIILKDFLNSI